ncbi:hypothetical protein [Streptomyces sp. NPDC002205]|uniref:hypothetical protein n=1 Tax=Streptomyces sp. NPDC002205 TaxID=3154411 RepID=UPI0033220BAD
MAVGDVRITSPWQEVTPPPREQVAVRQPSRVPVASLPATFTHRVTGMDGGAFYGSDGTGLMRVRLRYNTTSPMTPRPDHRTTVIRSAATSSGRPTPVEPSSTEWNACATGTANAPGS